MGLDNREGGNWITIFNGKFSQRVQPTTPGAITRVNKQNKTVYEKYYDSFTGKLVNIRVQDGAYGKSWVFDFRDNGEIFHLNLAYSNSYATALLKMLPNINLEEEMQVSPSVKEVEGKMKSSLFIKQNGLWIKSAYTKESPNGLPQMEQVQVKGAMVWDDSKRLVFLEAMVNEKILPKLPKDTTPSPVQSGGHGNDLDSFAADLKGEEDPGF